MLPDGERTRCEIWTPEAVLGAFVEAGHIQVNADGSVWRLKQGKKLRDIQPTRCDKALPNGYRQVQVYVDGKRIVCLVHRLVWFLHMGAIPKGHHVHHKNAQKDDNRIENLDCLLGSDHIAAHSVGQPAWNKGTNYGATHAYKKSQIARAAGYADRVKETVDLWKSGVLSTDVAKILGICTRQVYSRLQSRYAADYL
jgi:hypothetical protein